MPDRPVSLIVQQNSTCPLIKVGDRWPLVGRELKSIGGGKLCVAGLCSVYPKLTDILKMLPPNAGLPDDFLLCDAQGCDVAWRMEFTALPQTRIEVKLEPKPVFVIPAEGEKLAPVAPQQVPLKEETKILGAPVTPVDDSTRNKVVAVSMTRRLERGAEKATSMLRKQGPFLSRLPKELASELVSECTMRNYADGQIILVQGVVGEHLYLVGEGLVEVARQGKNGEETVLVTLGVGECFGEMSILTGDVTTAEVRARGPATILSIHKEKLEPLMLKRPALSREFSKLLAGRLKATNVSLESELARGVLGKLSMIPLLDLVQTLSQGRRTGTLVLNYMGKTGKLGFRNGNMVTATLGDTLGEEAFYNVACWADGDFCFEAQTEPQDNDPGKVGTDLMGLMMEAMRRIDEAKAQKEGGGNTSEAVPAKQA